MESRNLHFTFYLSYAVKKRKYISAAGKPAFLRAFIGIVTALLIMVKLISPFLHTHQIDGSSAKEVSISVSHCEACAYEAIQAIESNVAIVLPSNLLNCKIFFFEAASVFVNPIHSSSESRGPPCIS